MSVECVAPRSSGWDICDDDVRTAGDACIATPDKPRLSLAKRMASVCDGLSSSLSASTIAFAASKIPVSGCWLTRPLLQLPIMRHLASVVIFCNLCPCGFRKELYVVIRCSAVERNTVQWLAGQ